MPTNIKYIKDFSKGLITNIDLQDLPEDALYNGSKNFKMDSVGKITAINDLSQAIFTNMQPMDNSGWLSRVDGSYDLVYSRGSSIKRVEGFYATPEGTPYTPYSSDGFNGNAIAQNNSLHIGVDNNSEPVFIGEVNNYIFQGKAKATPAGSNLNDALYVDTEDVSATLGHTIRIQIATTSGNIQEEVSWSNVGSTVTITPNDMTGLSNGDTVIITNSDYSFEYYDNTETDNIDGTYTISNTTATTFDITGVSFLVSDNFTNQLCDFRKGDVPTFKYSEDAGTTWSSTQSIVKFQKYNLDDITYSGSGYGLKVWFSSVSDMTIGDYWEVGLSGTSTNAIIGEEAKLDNYGESDYPIITVSPTLTYGSTENFTTDKRHYIAYSLEYDRSQTSPLYWNEDQVIIPATSNPEKLVVKITVDNNNTAISKRVNAISLWHAESDTDISEPETYFRLIKRIETNNDKWRYTTDTNVVTNLVENTGNFGASYNAVTGILDSTKDILPKYKLGAALNSSLFIGDFTHPWFKHQAGMIIAKSQLGKYEMFNLTDDILKLPEIPTCLHAYRGKLLAFTDSKMYTINYDMYIEDVYNGVGCASLHTIAETEEGLYVANDKAMYKITGKGVEEISFPLRDTWITPAWMVYDGTEKMIVVGTSTDNTKYGYDIERNSWTSLELSDQDTTTHALEGKYQDSYIASGYPILYKLFGGSQTTMTLYKPITMQSPDEYKKWYEVFVDGTITTQQFREETYGTSWTNFTSTVEVKSGGSWSKAKILWLKITGTELKQIAIKFRKLLGIRT